MEFQHRAQTNEMLVVGEIISAPKIGFLVNALTGEVYATNQKTGKPLEIATFSIAVDQQNGATREIAGNVQQAASGTSEVTDNILGVKQAANETGVAASKLLSASTGLSSQSEQLKIEVNGFLGSIRAA